MKFCDFDHHCITFPCLGDVCLLLALVGFREDRALDRMDVFLGDNFTTLPTNFCEHAYLLGLPEPKKRLALPISLH